VIAMETRMPEPVSETDAIQRAVEFGVDITFRVLSLPALIRSKKAAGREKDLRALPELEALLELKKRGGA